MSRKEEVYLVLCLIMAVLSCVAAWLALPQVQALLPKFSTTLAPTTQAPTPTLTPSPSATTLATRTTTSTPPSATVTPALTSFVSPTQPPSKTPTATPSYTPSALPPGVACPNPYEVKPGDWLYKLARLCGVLPQDILAANPGINGLLIYPGQKLNMPTPGATPVKLCIGTYAVKSGDTLMRIAYNCGLTAEELAVANGITFPYIIKPGQVLKYP